MTGIRLGVAAAVLIVLSPARSVAQSLDASRIRDVAARGFADRAFRRTGATSLRAAVEDNALGAVAMNQAFFLVAAHAVGLRPSLVTAALAKAVALEQTPAGDWTALQERPPSNHSRFTFTALGLRALQLRPASTTTHS